MGYRGKVVERSEALRWVGTLSEREMTMFALGLYAGEGEKTKGSVGLANTNPAHVGLFATWLRRSFEIDERRRRGKIYLHERWTSTPPLASGRM